MILKQKQERRLARHMKTRSSQLCYVQVLAQSWKRELRIKCDSRGAMVGMGGSMLCDEESRKGTTCPIGPSGLLEAGK